MSIKFVFIKTRIIKYLHNNYQLYKKSHRVTAKLNFNNYLIVAIYFYAIKIYSIDTNHKI